MRGILAVAAAAVALIAPAAVWADDDDDDDDDGGTRPVLAWTPSTNGGFDYGTVAVGQTESQTFMLTNTGRSRTGRLKVTLSGSAAFAITADGCTGTRLRRGQSCSVAVDYTPTAAGATDTATLSARGRGGDDDDRPARASITLTGITVGNQEPDVEFVRPVEGQPFRFGDAVQYDVTVVDEAAVDCSRVRVHYILGHDTHEHTLSTTAGCTGTIQTTAAGHDPATDNITAVFVAEYTDPGGLTGRDQVVLGQDR